MKEAIEKFIEMMDSTNPSLPKRMSAMAALCDALEGANEIPDDIWLIIPIKRRATIMLGFVAALIHMEKERGGS